MFLGAGASLLLAALTLAALRLRIWQPGARRQTDGSTGRVHLPTRLAAASLFSRTHHEKLQDPKYLQSLLEAELGSQRPEAPPANERESPDPPSFDASASGEENPALADGQPPLVEGICAKSEK